MYRQIVMVLAATISATFHQAALSDQTRQGPEQVRLEVAAFLERESQGTPGKVTIEVGKIDARLVLKPCTRMETFFPAGSRAWGTTSVGVRCAVPAPWTIYVPARVIVSGNYLITARPLRAGQTIAAGDFVLREGELSQLPVGILTDPNQVLGRHTKQGLQAGQPLRKDILREAPAVLNGQPVVLMASGNGFRISSEGRSLGRAAEGEVVQVRTLSGSIVSGIVRAGSVVEVFQ
ncbi:MAG: flagellar basal body P-ring formation chaperone FlgA [Burkholderiales bacterium]